VDGVSNSAHPHRRLGGGTFDCVRRRAVSFRLPRHNSSGLLNRGVLRRTAMSSTETQLDTGPAPARPRLSWKSGLIALGVLAWVSGIAWGIQKIQAYSSTPGVVAAAPASWPGSALVEPKQGESTLVMFMHPQCSCTRASLAELQAILDRTHGAVSAWVVVLKPNAMGDEWTHSATWKAARAMPGVTVVMDQEGAEAGRFGASTSGHTVLYDARGQLQFTGGITAARGHVGDNTGRQRVVSLVETDTADSHQHEVYGCGLHDPHPRMDNAQVSSAQ
jgi:hypothetical protein